MVVGTFNVSMVQMNVLVTNFKHVLFDRYLSKGLYRGVTFENTAILHSYSLKVYRFA